MPIPIQWGSVAYRDKYTMTKRQEEIHRVETSTKKEEAEPTPKEDHTIEDIIEEIMTDEEAFQET